MTEFLAFFTVKTTLSLLLALLILIAVLTMIAMHRNPNSSFDVKDLVSKDGKIDEKKFTRFGAWVVSTWGFVYLIVSDKLSEWYFIGYMGAWVANAIFDKYVNKDKEK